MTKNEQNRVVAWQPRLADCLVWVRLYICWG